MSHIVEVKNITYNCTDPFTYVDQSARVLHTLPSKMTVEVEEVDADYITQAVEGDWLVTGYDYRKPGGRWKRYDEDMSWLYRARAQRARFVWKSPGGQPRLP